MKKLLLSITFFGFLANAQTVIFDQTASLSNGIVSTMLSNDNAVWSADDFQVTTPYQLTKITAFGFQNDGTFADLVLGLNVYIYTDNGGKPSGNPTDQDGTTLLAFSTVDLAHPNVTMVQDATSIEITLDVLGLGQVVNLEANTKYWLVVAPKLNLAAYTDTARFNWITATEAIGSGTDSQLVDPFAAFGTAAPVWTSCATLTGNAEFKSLSFALEGQVLSTTNNDLMSNVSTYPNPVSDILNIKLNNSFENVSFELVDLNGRKLFEGQTDAINMSGYNAGVYILNVLQDGANVGTQKIIKK